MKNFLELCTDIVQLNETNYLTLLRLTLLGIQGIMQMAWKLIIHIILMLILPLMKLDLRWCGALFNLGKEKTF